MGLHDLSNDESGRITRWVIEHDLLATWSSDAHSAGTNLARRSPRVHVLPLLPRDVEEAHVPTASLASTSSLAGWSLRQGSEFDDNAHSSRSLLHDGFMVWVVKVNAG
jgi:hypothetical protein